MTSEIDPKIVDHDDHETTRIDCCRRISNDKAANLEQPCREMIRLTEGKQFSRLLYTNPVCFLSVTTDMDVTTSSHNPSAASSDEKGEKKRGAAVSSSDDKFAIKPSRTLARRNVMVLSWLTATNNKGSFIFSLNRNRFSSGALSNNGASGKFVLAVPVQGMEDLVTSVGSVSGRFGSKFPGDYDGSTTTTKEEGHDAQPVSKRQRRKQPRFPTGIPNLQRVSIGINEDRIRQGDEFAIQGTVAHLVCQVMSISSKGGDEGHDLFSAQVVEAFVHPNYWDISKNIFRPASPRVPPYLTFFGSQTFGYVVAAPPQEADTMSDQEA